MTKDSDIICKNCGSPREFYDKKRPSKKGYFMKPCAMCRNNTAKKISQTKNGVITGMYSRLKARNIQKWSVNTSFSKQEFTSWVYQQESFIELYENWVKSGYKRQDKPTVDRIDDFQPYIFENMQIISWLENHNKQAKDILEGKSTSGLRCRAIRQLSIPDRTVVSEFHSISHAQRVTGIYNIAYVVLGQRPTAGGYFWEAINE